MKEIVQIKRLIAENKTQEAINLLDKIAESKDEHIQKLIILQSAKLNELCNDQIKGTISYEEEKLAKAKINDNILNISRKFFEEKNKVDYRIDENRQRKKIFFSLSVIGISLILLTIGSICFQKSFTQQTKTITIEGKVIETDFKPVKDVQINIDGTRNVVISKSDGGFHFKLNEYNIGDFVTFITFHESYKSLEKTEEIKTGRMEIILPLTKLNSD